MQQQSSHNTSQISNQSSIKHQALSPKPLNIPFQSNPSNHTSFDKNSQKQQISGNPSLNNSQLSQILPNIKLSSKKSHQEQTPSSIQESQKRQKIQEMLEQRKKVHKDLNKSLDSPTFIEKQNQQIQSEQQSNLFSPNEKISSKAENGGEYSNYQLTKQQFLAKCDEIMQKDQQKLKESQRQLKQSAMTANSINDTVSFNVSQSPLPQFIQSLNQQQLPLIDNSPNYDSPLKDNMRSEMTPTLQLQSVAKSDVDLENTVEKSSNFSKQFDDQNLVLNQRNITYTQPSEPLQQQPLQTSQLNSTNYQSARCVVQPHKLANQTLQLFSPFGNKSYGQQILKMERAYSPTQDQIQDRDKSKSLSATKKRVGGQKVEDRLLDLGKQREVYMKKLQDYYQQKENENIYDRPQINPTSQNLAVIANNRSDLYQREMEFLNNRENLRQKLATIILEEENSQQYPSPRINQASQQLSRGIENLHDWQIKSNKKIEQQREAKIQEEEKELQRLRSSSKQSKYNYKYLQNKQQQDQNNQMKIEERLIKSGEKTLQKIDQQRQQYDKEMKDRMNSPRINSKSKSRKYCSVPFYERLYSPSQQQNSDLQQYNSEISQIKYQGIDQLPNTQSYNNGFNRDLIDPGFRGNDNRDMQHISREDYNYQNQANNNFDNQIQHNPASRLSPPRSKFTPLRASRSPTSNNSKSLRQTGSKEKSRNRRRNSQSLQKYRTMSISSQDKNNLQSGFGIKPDYNMNYKKTYHKNVLLKEWRYLPLYERQQLWSRQKDKKTQNLKEDQEINSMKEATFKPYLFERQQQMSLKKNQSYSQKQDQRYSEIHKNKKPTSPYSKQQYQSTQRLSEVISMSPIRKRESNQYSINQKQQNQFSNQRSSLSPYQQFSPQNHQTAFQTFEIKSPQRISQFSDFSNQQNNFSTSVMTQNYSMPNLKNYQPLRSFQNTSQQKSNDVQQFRPLPQAKISLFQPEIIQQKVSNYQQKENKGQTSNMNTNLGNQQTNLILSSKEGNNNDKQVQNALQLGDDYYLKMYQLANNNLML